MEVNTSNESTETSYNDNPFRMPLFERNVKFYVLLTLQIPSICCTIFMLCYFKWGRLHSQIYGILIIINGLIVIIELPITLIFLHEEAIPSENICSAWITLNYSLFFLSIALMAWTSIERYLFIYHERVITKRYVLLHYGPIGCIVLYGPLFYLSSIVWHTCQPFYDVHRYVCGGACYQFELALGLIDWIGNILSTVFITFIINIIIIMRHLVQKHRMKRAVVSINRTQQWRRSLKLSAQLIAASLLYIIGWIPYTTIGLIQIFENTQELSYLLSTYFVYVPYIQTLFLPIICLLFMPDMRHKLHSLFTESYFGKIFGHKNRVQIIMNQTNMVTGRPPLINQ
ncbi:unnamed protein product [Rotaria sordida]|uniref:G-protein coupled receptors family 1 profile domain-containing protein n=3 Tax=Rotaria sordida TaxID=392033 RepID=A0A814TEZ1_9BILA|nr:unnamed protein product [Rotaria sordida]CAF1403749.1 unnamed protein product [Rotaria sordida]